MLARLFELTGLSKDTITLLLTIGPLVVSIAHSLGNNMLILSAILKLHGDKSLPTPSVPATRTPVVDGETPHQRRSP